MKSLIRLSFLLLLLVSCQNHEIKREAKTWNDSIRREEIKATIINDPTQVQLIVHKYNSLWTPTQNQLNNIDSIIAIGIKENQKDYYEHLRPDSLKYFYRQYICYIDNLGDSMVYMNAFCQVMNQPVFDQNNKVTLKRFDWQHHIVVIEDGGDCVWNVTVNLTKKKYINFSVNGVA